MLAGFTRGSEWRWQRRWNYPSGFFRLSLGGRYAIGLRVPIRISGEFSATRRVDGGRRDGGFPARLELTPSTEKLVSTPNLCSMVPRLEIVLN